MIETIKTQEQKSRETREKLIQATLDSLQEYGYHGASLSEILKKAGVSKGGWQHHFQNKKDMVAAAAETILEEAIFTTQELAEKMKGKKAPLQALFQFIWTTFYTGRHRDIWLEFNVACRTDEELREKVAPILEKFHKSMNEAWKKHFISTHPDFPIETILNLTIFSLRGMAIQSIAFEKPSYYKKLREDWIKLISSVIQIKNSL